MMEAYDALITPPIAQLVAATIAADIERYEQMRDVTQETIDRKERRFARLRKEIIEDTETVDAINVLIEQLRSLLPPGFLQEDDDTRDE